MHTTLEVPMSMPTLILFLLLAIKNIQSLIYFYVLNQWS